MKEFFNGLKNAISKTCSVAVGVVTDHPLLTVFAISAIGETIRKTSDKKPEEKESSKESES